jgi:hypothetical protein
MCRAVGSETAAVDRLADRGPPRVGSSLPGAEIGRPGRIGAYQGRGAKSIVASPGGILT